MKRKNKIIRTPPSSSDSDSDFKIRNYRRPPKKISKKISMKVNSKNSSDSDSDREIQEQERIRQEIQDSLDAAASQRQTRRTKKIKKKEMIPLSSSAPIPSMFQHLENSSVVLQIPIHVPGFTIHNSESAEEKEEKEEPDENDTFLWTDEERTFWETLPQPEKIEIQRREKEVSTFRKLEIPGRFHILRAQMNLGSKTMILRKFEQLESMEPTDNEYFKLQKYIDGILRIPFGKTIPFPVSKTDPPEFIQHFLNQTAFTLHQSIFGHDEVKERLLQFVTQSISNPKTTGHCIALCGPPGIGKTSLIRNGVAKALGRPFAFMPLGGANDGSYLDGSNYVYEGANWGRILDILITSKCMNPIIYIDEFDKVSQTKAGEDIFGVFTHLTDPSQNQSFQDKYFSGVEFDLSRVLFIFSFNDESLINPILKDRMTILHLQGFKKDEKRKIAQKYLWNELLDTIGFKQKDILMTESSWDLIMEKHVGDEPGVRNLKRLLEAILLQLNVIRFFPQALTHGSITAYVSHNNHSKIIPPSTSIQFPFELTPEWITYFLAIYEQKKEEELNCSVKMMYL